MTGVRISNYYYMRKKKWDVTTKVQIVSTFKMDFKTESLRACYKEPQIKEDQDWGEFGMHRILTLPNLEYYMINDECWNEKQLPPILNVEAN